MQIVDARWTPRINILTIRCSCNRLFKHRADRWTVRCPYCSCKCGLTKLRDKYFNERNRK